MAHDVAVRLRTVRQPHAQAVDVEHAALEHHVLGKHVLAQVRIARVVVAQDQVPALRRAGVVVVPAPVAVVRQGVHPIDHTRYRVVEGILRPVVKLHLVLLGKKREVVLV